MALLINQAEVLLRKKTDEFPEGRTSYRFKKALKSLVTVHGKSAFDTTTPTQEDNQVEQKN